MATYAKELSLQEKNPVIAVLFKDSDCTQSETWNAQYKAMKEGFQSVEGYKLGVPMIPKPTSEAWLLCALQNNAYQQCTKLENESGNDSSKNNLKKQLDTAIGHKYDNEEMILWVQNGKVDANKIDMPSFDCFKSDLEKSVISVSQETGGL